jgi:hypothetical protein
MSFVIFERMPLCPGTGQFTHFFFLKLTKPFLQIYHFHTQGKCCEMCSSYRQRAKHEVVINIFKFGILQLYKKRNPKCSTVIASAHHWTLSQAS